MIANKNLIIDCLWVTCEPSFCMISNFQALIPSVCLPLIQDIELINKQLQNDNKQLQEQIDGYTEEDLSLIESQARFKYGLIKDGEVFYQINTTVETENVAESSESAL